MKNFALTVNIIAAILNIIDSIIEFIFGDINYGFLHLFCFMLMVVCVIIVAKFA